MSTDPEVSAVWKWLATTLGGMLLGGMIAAAATSFQLAALDERIVANDRAGAIIDTRVSYLERELSDIKVLLREAITKMDRYHTQQ